jgi:hypothetical protein
MDHITIGKKPQTLGAISTPISALIGGIGQVLLSAFCQVASDNPD